MASVGEGELKSLKNLCNEITEALSPQGMETIKHSVFRNSIHLLFKNHAKTQQHHVDTELENGGIQEHHVFVVRAKDPMLELDESSKIYPIHYGNLKIRADGGDIIKVDENHREYVSGARMDLEGNNGRNLHLVRRLMKKQRMFIRLNQMIPSYKLIPEEERCSVNEQQVFSDKKVFSDDFEEFEHKKLTEYEEAMTKSENEMIEADRLMERMISAVEKLEIRVIKGEMKGRRLG
ncbi:hypothetical protein HID58_017638 [Brassica napus]|uniref:Histone deacetylase interacting domain-containing protein n=1 Tax=Brassica napus TaxID=3708 RepID=A0ABQ8D7R2_BRANA|nr:hypothetical protein HID58_091095 [Brassica napus]KAH0925382.1 hypothetical protein HID58_017638 [Brassica napus]